MINLFVKYRAKTTIWWRCLCLFALFVCKNKLIRLYMVIIYYKMDKIFVFCGVF